MVSSVKKSELLNFFGIKKTRKHICICLRCGSENILRDQIHIKCKDCGKIITIKSQKIKTMI